MTDPAHGGDGQPVRLSRSLLVTLTIRGPQLFLGDGRLPVVVTSAGLRLLTLLAGDGVSDLDAVVTAVAGEAGVSEAELWMLVTDLRTIGRLLDGCGEQPVQAADLVGPATTGLTIGPARALAPAPLPAADAGVEVALLALTPVAFRPVPGGFETVGPGGEEARFDLAGFLALRCFTRPHPVAEAMGETAAIPDALRPTPEAFAAGVELGRRTGLLAEVNPDEIGVDTSFDGEELRRRQGLDQARQLMEHVEHTAEARRQRRAATGDTRPSVFPITHPRFLPNLALGMVLASATEYEGGRLTDQYDLEPYWLIGPSNIRQVLEDHGPSIFLFSNYVWSRPKNLALSRKIKKLSPESITIHGGPDTPKYEGDNVAFFAEHPDVDITVRNEGEITMVEILAALQGRVAGRDNLDALAEVPGISFRSASSPTGVVRTADRDRVTDLSVLPSPFLTGIYRDFEDTGPAAVVMESVRGCPYGCTFCDWGSSTLSRLRKFPLERVYAELEWVARNKVNWLFIADANFGIFPQDVEIAQRIADLRNEYGYPREFTACYAKNTGKNLKAIIEILASSGLTNNGSLALQTVDQTTLDAVNRSNIKVEKYEELATEFRKEQLPLYTELMIGLPGATVDSFRADLQMVCDREVTARIHRTEMLVNSPMNDPAYREKWEIKTGPGRPSEMVQALDPSRDSLLVSTASYTEQDMETMLRLRMLYRALENNNVLRHVDRFVRHEAGLPEITFIERLDLATRTRREEFPTLTWVIDMLADCAVAPVSWDLFFTELRTFLVHDLGLAETPALDTVLTVQQATMPDRGRTFPQVLELPHDYAAWYHAMIESKARFEDWTAVVPHLSTFGPGVLEIDDPDDVCGRQIGIELHNTVEIGWEVDSVVARNAPHALRAHQAAARQHIATNQAAKAEARA